VESKTVQEFDPLFVVYSQVNGHTPEEQLAFDAEHHPGFRLSRYLQWVEHAWGCFNLVTGLPRCSAALASFDAWIRENYRRVGMPREEYRAGYGEPIAGVGFRPVRSHSPGPMTLAGTGARG